jgi:urea transport system permease protein
LLQDWAAQPDPARTIELVSALQKANSRQRPTQDRAPEQPPARLDRECALASHQLLAADPTVRLAPRGPCKKARPACATQIPRPALASETDEGVHSALSLALANLQLVDPDPAVRLAAVRLLGSTGDPLARTRLEALLAPGVETDAGVHTAAETSLAQVKRKLLMGEILGPGVQRHVPGLDPAAGGPGPGDHLRLCSGVINMAHGEMLMLGAYSTYVVQVLMQRYVPQAIEFYPLIALPVAFFVTAGIGMALERTIIRHLYGRPLETLLATWGISLMLIQLVRLLFGAQNVEVANPAWLSGGDPGIAQPGAAVQPHRDHRLCAVRGGAHLAAAEQDPPGPQRARRHPEPQHGRLLRRAHRARGHARLWPRLGYRRA